MKKRTQGKSVPLIVEPHPADYKGYPFITLIQYDKRDVLTIVDNAGSKHIGVFVLDLCGPAHVNEESVIEVAASWWDERKNRYPVSFEFSRRGLSEDASRIHRSFNIEFVTRVIGPLPRFDMSEVFSIKRRKRKPVPPGIEIERRTLSSGGQV